MISKCLNATKLVSLKFAWFEIFEARENHEFRVEKNFQKGNILTKISLNDFDIKYSNE